MGVVASKGLITEEPFLRCGVPRHLADFHFFR